VARWSRRSGSVRRQDASRLGGSVIRLIVPPLVRGVATRNATTTFRPRFDPVLELDQLELPTGELVTESAH
jgi:hypothetical protein